MISPAIIALLITGLCVVLWVTRIFPMAITGLIGLILMVLTGAASFDVAFSGFGNNIVVLMAGALVVGIAMLKTGVAQQIGNLALRISKGSEQAFLFVASLLGAIIAMFVANTAIVATFLPVVDGLARTSPSIKRKNLILPITGAIMIGGAGTLVGSTTQLTANGVLTETLGFGMEMFTLTGPMLGILALYMVYIMLFSKRMGNAIWGSRSEVELSKQNFEPNSQEQDDLGYKYRQYRMYAIFTLMIVLYITKIIPIALTALITALLCIIAKCVSPEDVVRELPWSTIIFLAASLGIAQSLTAAGSGELMGQAVGSVLGAIESPFVIFAILTTITLVLSQFVTNSTAVIVILPIALSLCEPYGLSPMAFTVGISLAASVACATPLAAAQIAMTQVAGYEFVDYVKYFSLPSIIMLVGIFVFVPLWYPLVA